eukprot:gene1323-382_t
MASAVATLPMATPGAPNNNHAFNAQTRPRSEFNIIPCDHVGHVITCKLSCCESIPTCTPNFTLRVSSDRQQTAAAGPALGCERGCVRQQ